MLKNEELIEKAIQITEKSYSPYSNYRVGAALLASSGKVYLGSNIENSSYGATICAERVAIDRAIIEGEREFEKIAIVGVKNGSINEYCSPCGICRQVMKEFCDNSFEIITAKSVSDYKVYTLKELLPNPF